MRRCGRKFRSPDRYNQTPFQGLSARGLRPRKYGETSPRDRCLSLRRVLVRFGGEPWEFVRRPLPETRSEHASHNLSADPRFGGGGRWEEERNTVLRRHDGVPRLVHHQSRLGRAERLPPRPSDGRGRQFGEPRRVRNRLRGSNKRTRTLPFDAHQGRGTPFPSQDRPRYRALCDRINGAHTHCRKVKCLAARREVASRHTHDDDSSQEYDAIPHGALAHSVAAGFPTAAATRSSPALF